VHDHIDRIDLAQKTARLTGGATLRWDKLLLAPGIDFDWAATEGLQTAHGAGRALHAWRAGPETLALRSQLEAMPDGGVFAISIPEAPYRCPPGPYERACMVAAYFRRSKPRSKVLILDANAEITSKAALFRKAWAELYPGMIEHWPLHRLMAVDGARRTLRFESHPDVQADVLNVLPVMRAGVLAQQTGLVNSNARWCQVHWLNFESTAARDLHLVGDALQGAQGMPKSAHMASSQAKVAAAAIVAELNGWAVDPQPMLSNVCLSLVDDTQAIHVASVHEYLADRQSFFPVAGSGGLSAERSVLEARYAEGWLRNIRADTLG
jgi:NADPH-dependent 2,4-dienoyl-CoA reductase/sulfur reductase-like enzyme